MGNFADGSLENWFLLLMDGEALSDRKFSCDPAMKFHQVDNFKKLSKLIFEH